MKNSLKDDLDKLLGSNRNRLIKDKNDKYDKKDVCKIYLVSECPFEYFSNTKYDMGKCLKKHDIFYKNQFEKEEYLNKYIKEKQYIEDTIKIFEKQISLIDDKLRKTQNKLNNGLVKRDIYDETKKSIEVLDIDVQKLMKDIISLAELGKIEESLIIGDQVEKTLALKKELISIALNPDLSSKKMKICDICGAKQAINDIEKKNKGHLEGKMHNGFLLLRNEWKKLKIRKDIVKLIIIYKKDITNNPKSKNRSRSISNY